MIAHLIAGVLTTLSLVQPADTVVRVDAGTRLSIENFEGSVVVRAWDRNEVRIETDEFDGPHIEIRRTGSVLQIRPSRGRDPDDAVDLELTVPISSSVTVSAPFSDVSVEGTRAPVSIETVEGDVRVRGGRGAVVVRTVEGDVQVEEAEGSITVSSGDGGIRILDSSGTISVDGIDGDILLDGIEATTVAVSTVDGDIWYDGPIRADGRYSLTTHDGDITCTVQEGADVTVLVATFDGDFRASFPVQLRGTVERRFELVLGRGSARLELEAFDGEIALIRPGERTP